LGQRRERESGGQVERYQWDGTRLASISNALGNRLADYQHAYGWPISVREGSERRSALADVHGTIQLLTDATGAIAGHTRTDVWGEVKAQGGEQTRLGHTGYLLDPEITDEQYAQARQYAPGLGRFTSVDPWAGDTLRPITLNKYLYGYGNPGSFVDPDGRAAAPPCASTPAGCVSPEQLQQQQILLDREATMVAGIDFEVPPELRQEPQGPGVFPVTEATPKNAFEANAWRSRQLRYEGNQNSLALDDRVGNVVAVICPWCSEKNELGIEQKVNPINRERLSTEERGQAILDGAGIATLGVEYYGSKIVARTLVETNTGGVATTPSFRRASRYQARATELNQSRRAWEAQNGTTSVVRVRNRSSQEEQTWIATESPANAPPRGLDSRLKPDERYVAGPGHAEETLTKATGDQWEIIDGGTSRNVCIGTCKPLLESQGLTLGGPAFPGKPDKTPYRMFTRTDRDSP
jgi:RHS repeat-associated protein